MERIQQVAFALSQQPGKPFGQTQLPGSRHGDRISSGCTDTASAREGRAEGIPTTSKSTPRTEEPSIEPETPSAILPIKSVRLLIKTKNTKKQHISIWSAWTKSRQHPRIALQERPEPNPVHSRGACPAVLVACITGGVLDLGARNERLGAREIFGATKTSRKKIKKSKLEQPCT